MCTERSSPIPLPITPAHPTETAAHLLSDLEEGLPPQEVHRRALQARHVMAGAHRALCFWLVEVEKRQIYRDFGCSSVFGYAELYLELAPHTIAEILRTGKEMAKLPLLAAACERGEIAPSKIREISRVATPQTEQRWLDLAKSSTCRQIERLVPLTPRGGLPPASAGQPPPWRNSASSNHKDSTGDGRKPESESPAQGTADKPAEPGDLPGETGDGQAVGPARYRTRLILDIENERMAVLEQAFEKAREETGERGLPALLEHIARVFLDGAPAGSGMSPAYRITLHQDPLSGVAWVEGAAGPQYVPESTVQEALCDAEILDLREDPSASAKGKDGQASPPAEPGHGPGCCREDAGKHPGKNPTWDRKRSDPARRGPRLRRTIPLTLRRKVLERDGRKCTTPGCNHYRFLSIHHIDPLHQGGEDREYNLTTVCNFCHRALHRGKLSATGKAPGNLVWRNRWGAILKGSS
jgi:hypothetical protein